MDNKKSGMVKYMQFSTVGIELALSVIVGGAIGYGLDYYLGTYPWLTIFWLICGVAAGFRSLYRMAKKYLQDSQENLEEENNADKRPD